MCYSEEINAFILIVLTYSEKPLGFFLRTAKWNVCVCAAWHVVNQSEKLVNGVVRELNFIRGEEFCPTGNPLSAYWGSAYKRKNTLSHRIHCFIRIYFENKTKSVVICEICGTFMGVQDMTSDTPTSLWFPSKCGNWFPWATLITIFWLKELSQDFYNHK